MNITPKQYALAWYELLSKTGKKETLTVIKKALNHLYGIGRLSYLSEILRNLEEIESRSKCIEMVDVVSAREMDKKTAEKIARQILKTDNIIVSRKTNPDLIGGVQIETKNKRWDLTIRNSLNQLKKQLI